MSLRARNLLDRKLFRDGDFIYLVFRSPYICYPVIDRKRLEFLLTRLEDYTEISKIGPR